MDCLPFNPSASSGPRGGPTPTLSLTLLSRSCHLFPYHRCKHVEAFVETSPLVSVSLCFHGPITSDPTSIFSLPSAPLLPSHDGHSSSVGSLSRHPPSYTLTGSKWTRPPLDSKTHFLRHVSGLPGPNAPRSPRLTDPRSLSGSTLLPPTTRPLLPQPRHRRGEVQVVADREVRAPQALEPDPDSFPFRVLGPEPGGVLAPGYGTRAGAGNHDYLSRPETRTAVSPAW